LLLYDFVGPSISLLSGDKQAEKDEEVNPAAADGKTETDVVQDLLKKSHNGRMYIAFCTS